jgi:3-methyl-2-oxobutanoate hydroxymethyltransferase
MPFMSYHVSIEETVRNAGRLIKEGLAQSVKLEGGSEIADKIRAVINAQIPVVGHLGLTPQSVNMFGGFKVQGKSEDAAKKIIKDALLLEEIGVFAIVLECVPADLATIISEKLSIPTIGIGAGAGCDGQVLVTQDMLGMYSDFVPKFAKQYAQVGTAIKEAVVSYGEEVRNGAFPEKKHTFKIDASILEKLK